MWMKLSVRNIVRLPKRTAILALIVFIVIAVISACAVIYAVTEHSLSELRSNYVFVATVIPNENITNTGDSEISTKLTGKNLEKVLNNTEYSAYNVTVPNSYMYLPNEMAIHNYPNGVAEEYPFTWVDSSGCSVAVTNNLYLERKFFDGTYRIVEGTDLSAAAYIGDSMEIVIPKWISDSYRLSVGDTIVTSNMTGSITFYRYIEFKIVGIYDTNDPENTIRGSMRAYIPFQVWKTSADISLKDSTNGISFIRADFVVNGQDGFEKFVKSAVQNGFDFSAANIIFNNSAYDRLDTELSNVMVISMIIMLVMLAAGGGIFIFFCIYFRSSRSSEAGILHALGMKKSRIALMFLTEILLIFVVFAPLGAGFGIITAKMIAGYVDDTTLSEANAMAAIKQEGISGNSMSELILPLEREVSVRISGSSLIPDPPALNPAYTYYPPVKYVIISEETWHRTFGTTYKDDYDHEWDTINIVGVSDVSFFGADEQLYLDAIEGKENYVPVGYVSRESGLEIGDRVRISRRGHEDYLTFSFARMNFEKRVNVFDVVGYYDDNPYYGGRDVLIPMLCFVRLHSTYLWAVNTTGVIEK